MLAFYSLVAAMPWRRTMLQRSLVGSSVGLEALILREIDRQRLLGRVDDLEIRRQRALAVRARSLEALGEEILAVVNRDQVPAGELDIPAFLRRD